MRAAVVLLAGIVVLGSIISAAAQPSRNESCCGMVQKALTAAVKIKPGVTRSDVETSFGLDGGLQAPADSRYVYRGCGFIHLDISFRVSSNLRFSPGDVVTKVSRPYLAFPAMD